MARRVLSFRPSPAFVLAVLALAVATAGVGFAAIPEPDGTVHTCYVTKTGDLRVVDQSGQCNKNETELELHQFAGSAAGGDLSGSYPNPTIAAGAVTPSKLGTIPAVRAFHSAPVLIPDDTLTVVPLDSESYDTASMHDPAVDNHRLTAPIAGVYLVSGHVIWPSGSDGTRQLYLRAYTGLTVASVAGSAAPPSMPDSTSLSAATAVKLGAGDSVEMVVRQTAGFTEGITRSASDSPELTLTWLGPA